MSCNRGDDRGFEGSYSFSRLYLFSETPSLKILTEISQILISISVTFKPWLVFLLNLEQHSYKIYDYKGDDTTTMLRVILY